MYYPSLEMLEKLDLKSYDLVPIKKEIYSDMITPIELMRKLKQYSKHVYMLESHEDKTKWGRYTFIGFDPKSEITCYNKMMKVDDKIFKVTHPKEYMVTAKTATETVPPAKHAEDQKQDNPGGPISTPHGITITAALIGGSYWHGHHSIVRRKTHCFFSFVNLFSKPGRDFDYIYFPNIPRIPSNIPRIC